MTQDIQGAGFAERLKRAADARQALLDKFRPRPTVAAPETPSRASRKRAELQAVRAARVEAKAARLQAAADAKETTRLDQEVADAAVLDAKRGERRERKALTKVEAKARRDRRYAARKARKP